MSTYFFREAAETVFLREIDWGSEAFQTPGWYQLTTACPPQMGSKARLSYTQT